MTEKPVAAPSQDDKEKFSALLYEVIDRIDDKELRGKMYEALRRTIAGKESKRVEEERRAIAELRMEADARESQLDWWKVR